jgi:hypothetical protein
LEQSWFSSGHTTWQDGRKGACDEIRGMSNVKNKAFVYCMTYMEIAPREHPKPSVKNMKKLVLMSSRRRQYALLCYENSIA